jgi:hypothetical protein
LCQRDLYLAGRSLVTILNFKKKKSFWQLAEHIALSVAGAGIEPATGLSATVEPFDRRKESV